MSSSRRREAQNPWYDAFPGVVAEAMRQFGALTGRHYRLFDYVGAPDAEQVVVMMGSGAETVEETVEDLNRDGARVGLLKVRLFRPWAPDALLAALPATTRAIAVLDRCKEPGADGEPLFKDVLVALAEDAAGPAPRFAAMPKVVGGRYGLASKEFTPAMVFAVFAALTATMPPRRFTVGIDDDVTHLSLPVDPARRTRAAREAFAAVFYGLGSDGTVSANKNSIKIIGDETDLHAQGYFVYDSKKSGAMTVSHLRFGPQPIRSAYLVGAGDARFIACHQPLFLERHDLLAHAAPGAVFLLNTAEPPERVWATLPLALRRQMVDKRIHFHVIDAYKVAARGRHGPAHQHGHADLLLRHLRHPAAGGGDRRDQACRREDLRAQGATHRRVQLPRHRPHARLPAPGGGARNPGGIPAGDRRAGPAGCQRIRPPADPAADRRASGDALPVSLSSPPTAPGRSAPRSTRSATWRCRSRSSKPTCARNAASASSSARTRRSAPRPIRPNWPTRRRRPSSRWRSAARTTRPAGA